MKTTTSKETPAPTTEELKAQLRDKERTLAEAIAEAERIESERKKLEAEFGKQLAEGDSAKADATERRLTELHTKRRRIDAMIPPLRASIDDTRRRVAYSEVEFRQTIMRQLSAESLARDEVRDELIAMLAQLQAQEVMAAADFERHYKALLAVRADGPVGGLIKPNLRHLEGGGVGQPAHYCTVRLLYTNGKQAWPL